MKNDAIAATSLLSTFFRLDCDCFAGKREDMEQQTIQRADSQPQDECMDEKDKERQRDLELIQLLLDDSPDQQRNVMENDEVY